MKGSGMAGSEMGVCNSGMRGREVRVGGMHGVRCVWEYCVCSGCLWDQRL